MIVEMNVPSPGESISEVEIATWLVADGEYVEKDQEICEIDSDKLGKLFDDYNALSPRIRDDISFDLKGFIKKELN